MPLFLRSAVALIVFAALAASPSARAVKHHKPGKAVAHKPAPSPLPKPSPAPPEILFTFDDGPAIGRSNLVLDALDAHHIKAVFFVNGWHFMGHHAADEKGKELLREELRRGHIVGNHTIHHYFLCGKVYVKRAREEIVDNAHLIEAATGRPPPLFRTPYGSRCKQLNAILDELKIKPVGWDLDSEDWKVRNAVKVEAWAKLQFAHLRGRNVILFHDIQSETVKAIPHILDDLDLENAARAKRGDPLIKVLDGKVLLDERGIKLPAVPPPFPSPSPHP